MFSIEQSRLPCLYRQLAPPKGLLSLKGVKWSEGEKSRENYQVLLLKRVRSVRLRVHLFYLKVPLAKILSFRERRTLGIGHAKLDLEIIELCDWSIFQSVSYHTA
ncbi:hypothetical protein PYW08_007882 [Mythimna loreyi]|uniref:Uncharacterized protein n=1 Tax=Mythimna loreyi TaxID=667449 RepID=A0ACC2QD03_9NEOP|nr:hypothetical protein PYW08_007882 [Mythimna loreyi]